MKVAPIFNLGNFVVHNNKPNKNTFPHQKLTKDTISFQKSTAYYLKKYNTLPEEIKALLSPKDAIDMFKDMENVQEGLVEGIMVGEGNHSGIYENPWLQDYYFLIVKDPQYKKQTIYSQHELGPTIWSDDTHLLQLIRKES